MNKAWKDNNLLRESENKHTYKVKDFTLSRADGKLINLIRRLEKTEFDSIDELKKAFTDVVKESLAELFKKTSAYDLDYQKPFEYTKGKISLRAVTKEFNEWYGNPKADWILRADVL